MDIKSAIASNNRQNSAKKEEKPFVNVESGDLDDMMEQYNQDCKDVAAQ